MPKTYNFSAGPAILPQEVIENCAQAVRSFTPSGLSLIEISHRSSEFVEVMEETRNLTRELLNLDESYEVIYLQGGASLQFLMVAMNLLETKAAYTETGAWAKNAIKEAKLLGACDVIGSSKDKKLQLYSKGLYADLGI